MPTTEQTLNVSFACCGKQACPQKSGPAPLNMATLTVACAVFGLSGWAAEEAGLPIPSMALYVAAYFCGGFGPARKMAAAWRERALNIDLLMVLAALGALFIGHAGEGAALLFLFSLAETLEHLTLERAARSIEALMDLRPAVVNAVRAGAEEKVPVEQVRLGEFIRVRPAERLGLDGVIEEGVSSLDESTLTGESVPVEKGPGAPVFAGTLNYRGTLLVRVTSAAGETMLARIVRKVREAQAEKTRLEHRIARWQKPYVAAVLAVSVLVGLFAFWSGGDSAQAFYRAMLFLVAASPCAVVISAPAAMLSAISRAARRGVVFKGAASIERLAKVRGFALDKTGTLTCGEPRVESIRALQGSPAEVLALAASLEKYSEHLLGKAILDEAKKNGAPFETVADFQSTVGAGVCGQVAGRWSGVGKPALFARHDRTLPEALLSEAQVSRERGETALIVWSEGGPCGVIGVADRVRPEAREALKRLETLRVGSAIVLTGDHEEVARAVSSRAGAKEYRANLLPEEKVAALKELSARRGPLAFAGDGVNDAPALAAAHVSFAMGGSGTDVALDAADVVLLKNDLRGLPFAVWLSQRTRAAVRRGLCIAFGSIALNVAFSLAGWLPLWMAVLLHEGSTVLAILSGLWLLAEPEPAWNPPCDKADNRCDEPAAAPAD